jgi:hypothetical protein
MSDLGDEGPAPLRSVDRLVGMGVLLALAAFGVGLAATQPDDGLPSTEPAPAEVVSSVEDALGPGPWAQVAGEWGTADGMVRVVEPAPLQDLNLLLTDVGWVDGRISTTYEDVLAGAGLVFRARSPGDLWVVLPAPAFATWSLEHVVDGEVVTSVPAGLQTVSSGSEVVLQLDGATASLQVAGARPALVLLDDDGRATVDAPAATQAGFWVDSFDSTAPAWSGFSAEAET